MAGPLTGIRVVEMAAIGPVPFCGMLLADMGADVVRVDRSTPAPLATVADVCGQGKRSIQVDLKQPSGVELFLRLADVSDILIEGMRPGVAERLGIGPEVVAARNANLIYGRMTGWGQDGPMAGMAGHDINYIGIAGALGAIGGSEPVVPLNLIGDYGGGAMYLTTGLLAALHERSQSGEGQVVDAAMVDGAASLMTPTFQLAATGLWSDQRQSNLLDGGAPFYRTYETADGKHMAVGALEPQFFARLLEILEIDPGHYSQMDRTGWPDLAAELAARFRSEPRIHWESVFDGEDACVTPVLSLEEAPYYAQNRARQTFMYTDMNPVPAAAPRFARTPSERIAASPLPGEHTSGVLAELGCTTEEIETLAASGVIGMAVR